MILNSNKKVICIREIPSNVIEEAIFILKENVMETEEDETYGRTKDIILKEAEEIVEEYISKVEYEGEEDDEGYQIKNKSLKKEIIYIIGILTILAICILKVI